MPPAAPDDLIRQHSRALGDNPALALDQTRQSQEHESSGKKKKGKSGKKNKGAKAATEGLPEELYVLPEIADPCEVDHDLTTACIGPRHQHLPRLSNLPVQTLHWTTMPSLP